MKIKTNNVPRIPSVTDWRIGTATALIPSFLVCSSDFRMMGNLLFWEPIFAEKGEA